MDFGVYFPSFCPEICCSREAQKIEVTSRVDSCGLVFVDDVGRLICFLPVTAASSKCAVVKIIDLASGRHGAQSCGLSCHFSRWIKGGLRWNYKRRADITFCASSGFDG